MSALPPLTRAPQTLDELGSTLVVATRAQHRSQRNVRRLSSLGVGLVACVGVLIGANLNSMERADSTPTAVLSERAEAAMPTSLPPTEPRSQRSETANAAPSLGVTPDPASLLVLVDHDRRFPPGWTPAELVAPDVEFTFSGQHPKRMMRPDAATALEEMFAAAAHDGIVLRAVSGYRSESTQADLFSLNERRKGTEAASRVSARAGHSEHQSGLAMDVTGASSSCVLETCFGDTAEFAWLERHAARFGFIVRYPDGGEAITGYQYEPWHLRYVGADAATDIVNSAQTLEQWLGVR